MTVVSQQHCHQLQPRVLLHSNNGAMMMVRYIQQYYRFFHILIQNLPSTDRRLNINSDDSKYDGP